MQRNAAIKWWCAVTAMLLSFVCHMQAGADPHRSVIELILDDLANDEVRWNAHDAMEIIREIGPAAIPELEAALQSPDYQKRQLSAHLLRHMPDYEPSDALLVVTVEGLRDDSLPVYRMDEDTVRYTGVYNAMEGTTYLIDHPERASEALTAALNSDDYQQKFLSAYLLGMGGIQSAIKKAAPILIPHLSDNKISGDAVMAAAALYGFGHGVLPDLLAAVPTDAQQRELLDLIILDLTMPPRNRQELEKRKGMHNITCLQHDPVIEHRYPYQFPSGLTDPTRQGED